MTQPFHFANGQLAHNAEDLLQLCRQFPQDGVDYLVREDLEKWLSYIGQDDIAQCAANARQAALDDRQKLEEFLTKCHALSSPESQDPVTETPRDKTPTPTVVEETTVSESKSETSTVASSTPEVAPTPAPAPAPKSADISPESSKKPSFFKVIARLIVNILYRNKS